MTETRNAPRNLRFLEYQTQHGLARIRLDVLSDGLRCYCGKALIDNAAAVQHAHAAHN